MPNLTIGPPVVASLRRHLPEIPLDCHLMVTDPVRWLEPLAKAGATSLTFHWEAVEDAVGLIQAIRNQNMKAALAFKPATPLPAHLPSLFPHLDMILIMTVEPGFGGQGMLVDCLEKVRELRHLGYEGEIQVDGGVTVATAKLAKQAGASVLVAGTAIVGAPDWATVIQQLKE